MKYNMPRLPFSPSVSFVSNEICLAIPSHEIFTYRPICLYLFSFYYNFYRFLEMYTCEFVKMTEKWDHQPNSISAQKWKRPPFPLRHMLCAGCLARGQFWKEIYSSFQIVIAYNLENRINRCWRNMFVWQTVTRAKWQFGLMEPEGVITDWPIMNISHHFPRFFQLLAKANRSTKKFTWNLNKIDASLEWEENCQKINAK